MLKRQRGLLVLLNPCSRRRERVDLKGNGSKRQIPMDGLEAIKKRLHRRGQTGVWQRGKRDVGIEIQALIQEFAEYGKLLSKEFRRRAGVKSKGCGVVTFEASYARVERISGNRLTLSLV